MATEFDIPQITFNGHHFYRVELTDSAMKHFGANSERFYRYVVAHLHGQTWGPAELGHDGAPRFITASCTTYIRNLNADSDYRETWFSVTPTANTIRFFHGSSIRQEQYEKAAHRMQLQFGEGQPHAE